MLPVVVFIEMRILAFAVSTAGEHVCPQRRPDARDKSPGGTAVRGEEKRAGGERQAGAWKHPGSV